MGRYDKNNLNVDGKTVQSEVYITDKLTDELYNMKNDPQELNNLIGNAGCADVVERMKKELGRLKRKTDFRFPEGGKAQAGSADK